MFNRLKQYRIQADLTQEELANLTGVTRQTIGLIEKNNYNPSLRICIKICEVLDKTLDDVFWPGDE